MFLDSEFGYIELRPRRETNPGEMKPHTSLSSKISRFSRLHTGTRKCVGSTNKNGGINGLKKMGFWRPDSLLSCIWMADSSKKKEFSKLSGLVWTGPQLFYDPFTFVNECNVGNGADSNELRLVSQENVARKCRLHNAKLFLHYPDSF